MDQVEAEIAGVDTSVDGKLVGRISRTSTKLAVMVGMLLIVITPFWLNGLYNPHLAKAPLWFWLADVGIWVVIPGIAFWMGLHFNLFRRRDLGFRQCLRGRRTLAWFGVTLIAMMLGPAVHEYFNQYVVKIYPYYYPPDFSYAQVVPPTGPESGWFRLSVVLYMGLSAGLVEEGIYRGLMRHVIGRGWIRTPIFVVVSAVIFAGAHWEGGERNVAYAACFGLVMAGIYIAADNIWPCVAMHALVDWIAFAPG